MNTLTIPRNGKAMPEILKDIPAQIASVLAHEVRNPITNISLAVEMLESHVKNDEAKVYLDIILRSSMRINILINELLKNHQNEEVHTEMYSIHQLIDEVLAMAEDRIRLKNIVVYKEYAVKDCDIALNQREMKIALTNIIINAIDAMTQDKGELKLVTKADEHQCTLLIEDNGCGISTENMKSIFKPYFTNKPGGMGLGLATTQDILRLNNVIVNVESVVDEGTRFILQFKKTTEIL
ncbi:MAG: ATP-binding protein [Chitinophagaceae bacterium]